MSSKNLRKTAQECLLSLATPEGINASGKGDVYGCIFGRDSAITILKILHAQKNDPDPKMLEISRRALVTLVHLQGKQTNIESGEEPGKFIHEFRTDPAQIERLKKLDAKPWYVYADGTIRNYDSIDSTPLALIAIYKYWQMTKDWDKTFLMTVLPSVEAGLNWIITYGDKDKDLMLGYELPEQRKHGGLVVQSWTDSHESMRQANGRFPKYPIAPVEVQGYAWLALKLWSDFYKEHYPEFAQKLLNQANLMKKKFNNTFVFEDYSLLSGIGYSNKVKKALAIVTHKVPFSKFLQFRVGGEPVRFVAQALDGNKKQIKTITGNALLLLWAAYEGENGKKECILDDKFIPDIVKRSFMEDMFDEEAGVRTMSTFSPTFNAKQDSYHNGSFWPVLNGMAYEGLVNMGYEKEAQLLKGASIKPLEYFGTPIELYVKGEGEQKYLEYCSPTGQTGCKEQAWTAASLLDFLS